MAFQLSPGVLVTERDLTSIVPAVATTAGGFAGAFQWGPVDEVTTIDSENELVAVFGKPNDDTYESFFTAANFLSYGNNLQVIRVVGYTAKNAIANAAATAILIKNEDEYEATYSDGSASVGEFAAKFAGNLGNSLKVSMADGNTYTNWVYASTFDSAPGRSDFALNSGANFDEMHIIVIDEDGAWTGTPNTVLEKFPFVSKASDAKAADGTSIFYKNVINNQSKYVWWMDHPTIGTNWGSAAQGVTFANLASNVSVSLSGGLSNDNPVDGNIISALNIFANDELFDVSLIPMGAASSAVVTSAISLAENRKDCVVFASPELSDVVNNIGDEATDVQHSGIRCLPAPTLY